MRSSRNNIFKNTAKSKVTSTYSNDSHRIVALLLSVQTFLERESQSLLSNPCDCAHLELFPYYPSSLQKQETAAEYDSNSAEKSTAHETKG
jgi:hypothetical protein